MPSISCHFQILHILTMQPAKKFGRGAPQIYRQGLKMRIPEENITVEAGKWVRMTPGAVGKQLFVRSQKKLAEMAPLSVLFTSVDWEGYLQGQGDMNNAYHLHLLPRDAAALITSISICEIVCKDLYLQWWSICSEVTPTHWKTQTNRLPP